MTLTRDDGEQLGEQLNGVAAAAAAAMTDSPTSSRRSLVVASATKTNTTDFILPSCTVLFSTSVQVFEQLYSSPSDREKKQLKIYNKHQNTIGTLDCQAVTHV